MSTEQRVTNLDARRDENRRALEDRLLRAYDRAKAVDDGRRFTRADLLEARRQRL